jgi:hypothetical protein
MDKVERADAPNYIFRLWRARADFSVGLFDQAKIDRVIGTCPATLLPAPPRRR